MFNIKLNKIIFLKIILFILFISVFLITNNNNNNNNNNNIMFLDLKKAAEILKDSEVIYKKADNIDYWDFLLRNRDKIKAIELYDERNEEVGGFWKTNWDWLKKDHRNNSYADRIFEPAHKKFHLTSQDKINKAIDLKMNVYFSSLKNNVKKFKALKIITQKDINKFDFFKKPHEQSVNTLKILYSKKNKFENIDKIIKEKISDDLFEFVKKNWQKLEFFIEFSESDETNLQKSITVLDLNFSILEKIQKIIDLKIVSFDILDNKINEFITDDTFNLLKNPINLNKLEIVRLINKEQKDNIESTTIINELNIKLLKEIKKWKNDFNNLENQNNINKLIDDKIPEFKHIKSLVDKLEAVGLVDNDEKTAIKDFEKAHSLDKSLLLKIKNWDLTDLESVNTKIDDKIPEFKHIKSLVDKLEAVGLINNDEKTAIKDFEKAHSLDKSLLLKIKNWDLTDLESVNTKIDTIITEEILNLINKNIVELVKFNILNEDEKNRLSTNIFNTSQFSDILLAKLFKLKSQDEINVWIEKIKIYKKTKKFLKENPKNFDKLKNTEILTKKQIDEIIKLDNSYQNLDTKTKKIINDISNEISLNKKINNHFSDEMNLFKILEILKITNEDFISKDVNLKKEAFLQTKNGINHLKKIKNNNSLIKQIYIEINKKLKKAFKYVKNNDNFNKLLKEKFIKIKSYNLLKKNLEKKEVAEPKDLSIGSIKVLYSILNNLEKTKDIPKEILKDIPKTSNTNKNNNLKIIIPIVIISSILLLISTFFIIKYRKKNKK